MIGSPTGVGRASCLLCVCHVSGVALFCTCQMSNASTSGSLVSYLSKFDMVVLLLEVHDNTFGSTLLGCYFSGRTLYATL